MVELWRKIGHGDAAAMKMLYQEGYQPLYAYGFRIIADQEKVKDCVQELFCEVWMNRKTQTEVLNVMAYLKICLRNKILKEIASDKNTTMLDELTDHPEFITYSYEQLLIESQHSAAQKHKLDQVLKQLTTSQFEIIRMKFFEELSYNEIASLLNITVRTVYNHLHTALLILRANFRP